MPVALDPLGLHDNGGPTQTLALLPNSIGIDSGDPTFAPPPAYDQRGSGFARVQNGRIDIGAIEFLRPTISINDVTLTEGNSGTKWATFTVRLSSATPVDVSVDYTTANGTASAGTDYEATTFTLGLTAGVTSEVISVLVNGDTVFEPNETFFVNLSNPVNATLADSQGRCTVSNDDPIPSLSITDKTVNEGNSGTANANFVVTLSAASSATITVQYSTATPGSNPATPGIDYVAIVPTTLTFNPGELSKTVTVLVNGDLLDEVDERFAVNLSSPANATIADKEGVGTIVDNDTAPNLVINNVTVIEGNAGTVNATFTITLSVVSGKTVTVQYNTATPGSYPATAGTDYVAVPPTTLTFTPGQTTKTVTVLVNGDTLDEDNERFAVNLKSAGNATIADNEGVGTITDNDGAPSLSVNDVSLPEGPAQGAPAGTTAFTFTVTLSAPSGKTVTVKAQTLLPSSLIATPGVDYTALPLTTLTFLPGQTSKTVTVLVNGDTSVEGTERFAVKLSAQSNATIADSEGVGSILNDDVAALLLESDTPSQ